MLKARCPSCGKSASFDAADAGQPVVCLACGSRYTAPDAFPATPPPQGISEGGAPLPTHSRVGRTFWVASGLGVLAAVAAALLVVLGRPDPIDRATAVALASEAQAHAAEGRLADAHRKYHELETLVGRRSVRDPEARRVIDQAMQDKQRVYSLLLDQIEGRRNTTLPAATTQSLAVTTAPAPAGIAAAPVAEPARTAPISTATTRSADPATSPTVSETVVDAGATRPAPPATVVSEVSPATAPATQSTPSTQPALATGLLPRPPIKPMPEQREGVTDEEIGRAIQKGVDHVLARFDPGTHFLSGADPGNADGGGLNALAVYALMQCGQAINDDRLNVRGKEMGAKIEVMKASRLKVGQAQVYATAIRATALSLFNRPQDRVVLKQDVNALLAAHSLGSYSYSVEPRGDRQRVSQRRRWDNSNSQYGLLGVWAGAEAGIEVPSAYWMSVENHWIENQLSNGMWGYVSEREGKPSMTAAGVASLFVTHDWLDAPKYAKTVGREPFSPSLQRALDWFEQDSNSLNTNSSYWGYTLYGIERVGLASGFKFFGQHDWYRHLAADVIGRQAADGSWGDTVDTSFALLFLARGRHPVLMNKVRFSGYWANRPRDVAHLARYAARSLERELNWQVVPLRPANEWTDWLDSPILYIASHKEPTLIEQDYENLLQFVAAGGLLFTHADGGSDEVNRWASDLAGKLFGRYEMTDLPPDHPVYNLVFKIEGDDRPPLRAVSNGSRLLMVHSPTDIARSWQLRQSKERDEQFELGVNLFLYSTGKRDLRNRLESTFVSDPGAPVNGSVNVARLEYPGNWDPEPAAWHRFARWFQRQTGTGINVTRVGLASLKPGQAPLAHLTGTGRYDFSAADATAVKGFVEAGGVLLIDQVGGTGTFDAGVAGTLLATAFPGAKAEALDPGEHPLFRSTGPDTGMDDLRKPRLRPFGVQGRVNEAAPISGFAAGRGHVILTPIDITSGLLGSRTWGIAGLHPDYAPLFVKNLVFWTLDGQADK